MIRGREFLEVPYGSPVTNADGTVSTGWPILAGDSDAHLSYLQLTTTACPIHDENYVPEDELEPVPGDPDYEWPDGYEPPDWWPWQDPDGGDDGDPDQTTPSEPGDPGNSGDEGGDSTTPSEPEEPTLPTDPIAP